MKQEPAALVKGTLVIVAMAFLSGAPVAFPASANLDTVAKTNSPGPFYIKGGGGISWLEDLTFVDHTGTGKLEFYPGARFDVAGGYQFTSWLAAELEVGLILNGVRAIDQDGAEDNTLVMEQRLALVNGVFQLPVKSPFHAFAGAGAGGVFTTLDSWIFESSEPSGNDLTFGYQLFAGAGYEFNPRMALDLQYKFMRTEPHGFDRLSSTRNHSITLSVSVRF